MHASTRTALSHAIKKVSKNNIPLQDSFGRKHDYLRVSLTERCNLRCRYCMPAEGITLTNKKDCLSLTDLKHLTSLFVQSCGIKKIRLTGGEPTIDRELVPMLEHLNAMRQHSNGRNLETIAMTTNGMTLKRHSLLYKNSGLDMVNVSLDTLKPKRFEQMTRRRGWQLVFDGLMKALETGFDKVKLNCVVMRDFNLDELVDFVQLATKYPLEVRFIEFMPFMGNKWSKGTFVPYDEMLGIVREALPGLEVLQQGDEAAQANETSIVFKQQDMLGSIGFIASMTNNFCAGCNRLRLTHDGNLKVCLFGREETSLRDLLRNGASDQEIVTAIKHALDGKRKKHAGLPILQHDVSRPMIKIALRMFHSSHPMRSSQASNGNSDEKNDKLGPEKPTMNYDRFSHLDNTGKAKMVNVGQKLRVKRVAMARGEILIGTNVLNKLLDGSLGTKGDILTVAKIAGIMAAKSTCHLIPMCHQIPLDHIQLEIEPCAATGSLIVKAKVEAEHKTGVELECMTAVSVALLTIYDMCKSISRNMVISDVRLVYKSKPVDPL